MGYKLAFDLHLNPKMTESQMERIRLFQVFLGPGDIAVYGGDVLELTWYKRDEVLECKGFRDFCKRLRHQDILLYGNHDIEQKAQWPELFVIDGLIVMHGHQFDRYAGGCAQKTYYKWAPWIRNVWLKSPLEQKMAGDTSFTSHNGQIWGTAINWLEDTEYEAMVIGHTHDTAIIHRRSNKTLYGIGDLPTDGIYFDVDTMSLKTV